MLEIFSDPIKFREKLDEGIALREADIASGDRFLGSLRFEVDSESMRALLEHDPRSTAYLEMQMKLYTDITGVVHGLQNEGIDSSRMDINNPLPFYLPPGDAGYWMIIYGNIIRTLNLPRDAKILEVGAGPGGLTEFLTRSGLDVTMVEIRESNCDFVRERVARFGKTITAIPTDIASADLYCFDFDCILFYESFHHIKDYWSVMQKLRLHLSNTGFFAFAAEPITDDDPCIPFPWGLRMDGGSLGAARTEGWVEFGFQRQFFKKMMDELGFEYEETFLPGFHHSSVVICKPNHAKLTDSLKDQLRSLRIRG